MMTDTKNELLDKIEEKREWLKNEIDECVSEGSIEDRNGWNYCRGRIDMLNDFEGWIDEVFGKEVDS